MINALKGNRLTVIILISILLGAVCGLFLNIFKENFFIQHFITEGLLDWLAKVFMEVLKMLVVPVVFTSIVCGTISLNSDANLSKAAFTTILFYIFTTAIAVFLALVLADFFATGKSNSITLVNTAGDIKALSIKETLIDMFPSNPVKALADGNMLQIIIFSLLLGITINQMGKKSAKLKNLFIEGNNVVSTLAQIVFLSTPVGVFALIAVLVARTGADIFQHLANYFFTVIVVLLCQLYIVYPVLLKTFTKRSLKDFFKNMFAAQLFAFSTSSSTISIPVVLDTVINKLKVRKPIADFVIPLGATINMDGTAIMQGVATVFIANTYGIDIGFGGYLTVILMATLASIGTAGIPSVGLITLTMILNQVNLPVDGVALIIGVDRILDMLRTSTNITGDAVIACIVNEKNKKT